MENNVQTATREDARLKGNLSLMSLVFMGIAYMSPICIYLYYGIMTSMTGGMYALTILITGVVMSLTAFSYSKMSREFPVAGSVFKYVEKTINPYVGFVSGWGIILDYLLLPMMCYLSFGLYTNALIPAVPVWVWIIIGIVIVSFFSCRGVTVMAALNTVITGIPIIFVFVAFVFIIAYVAGGGGAGTFFDSTALYNPETFNISGTIAASAILCCGFVGFDAISTMSEEAKNPTKNIPRAIVLCCVLVAAIYFVMGYIMQLAWPKGYMEIENVDTGALELFYHIGRPWLATCLSIINILTALACCLSGQTAVSRILYGMGKENFLPKKFFGYISPKYHTPVLNILLTSVFGLAAIFFADNLSGAAALISFGALLGFSFVNLCVIILFIFRKKERSAAAIITKFIVPAIALMSCLYLLYGISPMAKIVGISWLALGAVILAIKTKGFRVRPEGMDLNEM